METETNSFADVVQVKRIANIHYFELTGKQKTLTNCLPFYELIYVDSGEIEIDSPEYTGPLPESQILILMPSRPRSISCVRGQAAQIVIVGFYCDCDRLERFSTLPIRLSKELQQTLNDILKEKGRLFLPPYTLPYKPEMELRETLAFGALQLSRLKLESFFIRLIQEQELPPKEQMQTDIRISEVYTFLNANFRSQISLNELSNLYNTNKNTLCTQFKQTYGVTIIDYLNSLRIQNAKVLISTHEYTITQIAEMVGISSVHYFSRLFKQYTSLTPSEYAKGLQNE